MKRSITYTDESTLSLSQNVNVLSVRDRKVSSSNDCDQVERTVRRSGCKVFGPGDCPIKDEGSGTVFNGVPECRFTDHLEGQRFGDIIKTISQEQLERWSPI